jgi:plastocyanin
MKSLIVATALATALGGTACSPGSAPSCPQPTASTSVTIKDFSFQPSCNGVATGATLTISNTGASVHTYTIRGTGVSVQLDPGAEQNVDLTGVKPGIYTIICTYHPQMMGALKIGSVDQTQ